MATKGMELIRDIGRGITPIVIGTLLVNGTVALAIIGPQGNLFLGWGMVIVGVIDIIVSFR